MLTATAVIISKCCIECRMNLKKFFFRFKKLITIIGRGQKRDKAGRSYEQKSTIEWKDFWMGCKDVNGDSIGDWSRRHDDESAKCDWCKLVFNSMIKFSVLS